MSNIHPVDFGDTDIPPNCRLEFRRAVAGELFFCPVDKVWEKAIAKGDIAKIVAIPDWTPPDWLIQGTKCNWIVYVKGVNGWFGSEVEPKIDEGWWSFGVENPIRLSNSIFHFNPPPLPDDHKASKRRIRP